MVWVTLPIVILTCGIVLVTVTAALLAYGLIHPDRMTDAKALTVLGRLSPGDLELPFAEVTFSVIDESRPPVRIDIAGWWMPAKAPSDRCVILLHGYSDAKVGAIAWAPLFHELGWNILAIDHRAHGESGGTAVTGGHFEKHDLSQVIDQIREQRPDATRQLILFGVSMGSAIAAHTAAMRDDLDAVIFESWVGDFIFASHAHTNLMGLPGGFIGEMCAHFAAWMTGADFRRDRAVVALPKIKCPVLLILGTVDPFADMAETQRVAGQMPNVEMWLPEDVNHVLAMAGDYQEYRQRIAAFLSSIPAEAKALSS